MRTTPPHDPEYFDVFGVAVKYGVDMKVGTNEYYSGAPYTEAFARGSFDNAFDDEVTDVVLGHDAHAVVASERYGHVHLWRGRTGIGCAVKLPDRLGDQLRSDPDLVRGFSVAWLPEHAHVVTAADGCRIVQKVSKLWHVSLVLLPREPAAGQATWASVARPWSAENTAQALIKRVEKSVAGFATYGPASSGATARHRARFSGARV